MESLNVLSMPGVSKCIGGGTVFKCRSKIILPSTHDFPPLLQFNFWNLQSILLPLLFLSFPIVLMQTTPHLLIATVLDTASLNIPQIGFIMIQWFDLLMIIMFKLSANHHGPFD